MDFNPPSVLTLLEHASALKAQHERLKAQALPTCAPDFRLLSFFHINENRLSDCLAFLLDPAGNHGQGDLFLASFCALLGLSSKSEHLQRAKSYTEYTIDSGRRLDILLTDNERLIGIENKPWATDQEKQLADYARWLSKETSGRRSQRDWLLVYLSNNSVSEASLPARTPEDLKEKIVFLTFHQLEAWLNVCGTQVQAPQVRSFVTALEDFVREDINGETPMALQNNLTNMVISSPENLTAAMQIAQNITPVKARLWKDFIHYLSLQLNPVGIDVVPTAELFNGKRWAGFFIVFNHDDKLALKWEFEYPNYAELVFGISARQQPTKRLRAELYKPVFDKLTQLFPEISAVNDKEGWWPWWSYADTLDIAVNWLAEPEAWALLLDRSEGSFAHKVIRQALAIREDQASVLFR